MKSLEELREYINTLIKQNNISYNDFAKLLGYTHNDIERLLSGELLLPPNELERIANIFGITKEELLRNKM